MKKLDPTMAQQVAQAISVFQEQRTGYPPKAVTVVLSDDTLVVTLHEALSPAEKALARTPEGAAQVQEFHRQLFKRLRRLAAGGDQAHHRGRGGRSRRGSGDDDRRRRACLHDRHDGAGVPARRQNLRGRLEREWIRAISHTKRRVCHVSPVEEKPGIGGGRRGRWFSFEMEPDE